jgi:hypothetical protein
MIRDHKDWLPAKSAAALIGISGIVTETWLEQTNNWKLPVVRKLGELTDEILKLEIQVARACGTGGEWWWAVFSLAKLQIARLVCKPWMLVTVSSFHRNEQNLRSQTQLRLDEGFLGF